MCKKFFHPNAPHNQEAKWKAEMKQEAKEKLELERSDEYKREQERWKTRHLLSSEEQRLKMELSFMYEPPPGVRSKDPKAKGSIDPETGKERGDGWSESVCYKCDKVGHYSRECTAGILFEWQRGREPPREAFSKDDPNIVDKPFGILVQKTRCMKCEVWGHSHTERICPMYGKARDSEVPILTTDPELLVQKMRHEEGLRLNKTDIWANGKAKRNYDLVYSDDEEQDDLLVNLVKKMRKDKSKPKEKKRKMSSRKIKEEPDSDDDRKRRKTSSSKNKKRKPKTKDTILTKVDKILDLKEKGKTKKYSEDKMMRQVDRILFADISSAVSQSEKVEVRNKFLDEVDDILGLGRSNTEEESSDEESSEEESDDDDLDEEEMRLLNLINVNKIDVKVNFQDAYPDTDCHFCRKKETNEHLARCPVYEGIMTGSEFRDIRSEEVRVVKEALTNIRSALIKRAEALSVTSLGEISAANMQLLTLGEKMERKKTREELIDEILATT